MHKNYITSVSKMDNPIYDVRKHTHGQITERGEGINSAPPFVFRAVDPNLE